ncbi:hypothetical protein CDD83_9603 [Cordyceps sp. RAO-2017]|nr:hypothetical protein CDD83_9603 [Cordyceps sp. RAO-2017]
MIMKLLLLRLPLVLQVVAASPLSEATSFGPRGPPCRGNTPTTRGQWCGHSINTDYTREAPNTGVTREYWLELTDVMVAPDGVSRPAIGNGTSIHFHGIRQLFTNQNDGVTSVTQCPTPVGHSVTYRWRALQYGSTWYHSHFALQAWEGVYGGLVINGPATANYDEDLGPLILTDWSHTTVDQFSAQDKGQLLPPIMDSGLINGTNTFRTGGRRLTIRVSAGKSYRIRLVNAAVDTHFKFSVDHHTLKVIAADLVPIKPYSTKVINISMGQRYDIVLTANQGHFARNFWMRTVPQACSFNRNAHQIRAIVHYDDALSTPSTIRYPSVPLCKDETRNLIPYIKKGFGNANRQSSEIVAIKKRGPLFHWTLNSTAMRLEWGNPTLKKIMDRNPAFRRSNAVIELPEPNIMFAMVIQTYLPVPHPIHLHGHDFYILAQGVGVYSHNRVQLNHINPPRRDTAILPALGYLVIAFETDNPGAWLMHCHIGFHLNDGFGLQFIERAREIPAIIDRALLDSGCAAWRSFQALNSINQDDSGV